MLGLGVDLVCNFLAGVIKTCVRGQRLRAVWEEMSCFDCSEMGNGLKTVVGLRVWRCGWCKC